MSSRPTSSFAPPRVAMALLVLLIVVQVTGSCLLIFGFETGSLFSLERQALASGEIWRILTFGFSTFAPSMQSQGDTGILASFLIFILTFAAIVVSGRECEKRLGSLRFAGMLITVLLLQATLSLTTLGLASAWSPLGIALMMLTFSLAMAVRDEDQEAELANDARVFLMLFPVMLALFSGALDDAFRPLLTCVAAGPVVAIAGLALPQIRERRPDIELGEFDDAVEEVVLLEDQLELLSKEDVRERTDALLARISDDGFESLSDLEKRELRWASQRLSRTDGLGEGPSK